MSDKLREAALAAYKAMIAAELSDGSKREWNAAVAGLRAALAITPSSALPHPERAPRDLTTPCRTSQKSAGIGKTPLCPG